MLFDYLYEYAVIVQEGNLSSAAAKLHLSDPTLGRHLNMLESQLGIKLLRRDSDGVHLLEDGRYVFDIALDVMAIEQSVMQHFSNAGRLAHERRMVVEVLGDFPTAVRLISKSCADLNTSGNNITVRYVHTNSSDVAESLLNRRDIDVLVGVSSSLEPMAEKDAVYCTELCEEAAAVVLEPGHPLATKKVMTFDDLRTYRFVRVSDHDRDTSHIPTGRHALWNEFVLQCRKEGFEPLMQPARYGSYRGFEVRHFDEVDISCATGADAEHVRESGHVLTPVIGLSFPISVAVRSNDELACQLVTTAHDMFVNSPAPTMVSNQSLYGSISKNGHNDRSNTAFSPEEKARLFSHVIEESPVSEDLVLPDGTIVDKAYVALRNRLNRIGDGLGNDPVESSYEAIMNLWSIEDAQAELEMPLLQWFTAYDYSNISGRPLEECQAILDDFTKRTFVYCVTRGGINYYYLLGWVFGIWEFSIHHFDADFLTMGIYGSDVGTGSRYPMMHVCPVDRSVVKDHIMIPYRDWQSYVKQQTKACIVPCQCRKAHDSVGDISVADRPLGTCLMFGEMAEYWLENESAQEIPIEECLAIAQKAVYDDGLIPQLYYSRNPEILCFCDGDVCTALSAIKATGGMASSMQYTSAYTLAFDPTRCISCGTCIERCPMRAIQPSETGDYYPTNICVGCGQCALVCPTSARILVPKADDEIAPLPSDLLESYQWRSEDRMANGYINDFTGSWLETPGM